MREVRAAVLLVGLPGQQHVEDDRYKDDWDGVFLQEIWLPLTIQKNKNKKHIEYNLVLIKGDGQSHTGK